MSRMILNLSENCAGGAVAFRPFIFLNVDIYVYDAYNSHSSLAVCFYQE